MIDSPSPWFPFMALAQAQARAAGLAGDVPIGAVLVDPQGKVLAQSGNGRQRGKGPLSHAEIEVMQAGAAAWGSWNLEGCTLVVTLEPCPMCAGAAVSAHLGRIVFGAWDQKMGACGSVWDIPRDPHIGFQPEVVGGVREAECQSLLTNFFRARRATPEL